MPTHEILIAGFGGQGVLTAGQILAYAANAEGYYVTWVPAYGPEQRGGTANCSVVISDQPVACPLVTEPSACIVMNQPSLDKFERDLIPGGLLVVNLSLCDRPVIRTDLRAIRLPATEIAAELGNARYANMVAVGALLGALPAVAIDSVLDAMLKVLGPDKVRFIQANRAALQRGMEIGALVSEEIT